VALLVEACLLAVYLGRVCLEGWRCGLPILEAVPFQKEAMTLEEQVLTGLAMYLWVVFVLWVTGRGWE